MRFLGSFALLAALSAAAPLCSAQAVQPPLKVGKYALDMQTMGSGPYTVIFEAGFAGDWSVWRKVAPALARSAKVVVYSRAGIGKSDPRPEPRTLAQSGAELEEMIQAAQLKAPFILVGHSYGGFLVRQFAARHPGDVAGMVFVDASAEGMDAALKKIDAVKFSQDQQAIASFTPAPFKAEYKLVQEIFDAGSLPQAGPLPDVPTVVLTSAKVYAKPEFILHTPAGMAAWRTLHEQFFRQFSNGSHVVTAHSGHYIQLDEPELVIGAVEQVMASATAQAKRRARQLARDSIFKAVEQTAAWISTARAVEAEAALMESAKASKLGEADINALAYELLGQSRPAAAAALMKFNVESFPNSDNAHDSYGEVLLALKQAGQAKVQFEQALALGRAGGRSPKTLAGFQSNLDKAEKALSAAN